VGAHPSKDLAHLGQKTVLPLANRQLFYLIPDKIFQGVATPKDLTQIGQTTVYQAYLPTYNVSHDQTERMWQPFVFQRLQKEASEIIERVTLLGSFEGSPGDTIQAQLRSILTMVLYG
jgi:hypothetical protein